jgi:polyadenylate-binding protein
VASIRVCRDTTTRRSLGYAYVNFHAVEDAERALETLNYALIKNKQCRIMWSQRDPSARKSGLGNVFIKNLDKSIDNKALYDTFSQFGNIKSCKVAVDEKGQPRGYGFVHFETEEAARLAIEKVNGMLINDKKVFVGFFQKRVERLGPDFETKFTNVFVKNMDESITSQGLYDMFAKYGKVTSHTVMVGEDGKSRGFGFVNFENPDEAKNACEALNGHVINEKPLFVSRAQKKAERQAELRHQFEKARMEKIQKYQGVNLFVKNLDEAIDDDKLRTEFTPFGTITSARVMRDDKGESKGFGFVCYSTPEEATKAVTELNGKMIGLKPIFVALAQRKEVRRAQLEAQHQQRLASQRMMRIDPSMQGGPGYMAPGMFYGQNMNPLQRQSFMFNANPAMMRRPWQPNPAQMGRGAYQPMPQYSMPIANRQAGRQRGGPQPGIPGQPGLPGAQPGVIPNQQPRGPAGVPQGGVNPAGRGGQGPRPNQVRGGPPGPGGKFPGQRGAAPGGLEPLTAAALANAPERQQKQMIGERLFPLVMASQPELAAKITGMLLEMDNSELILLLESPDALQQKIQEAIVVLEEHQKTADEHQ